MIAAAGAWLLLLGASPGTQAAPEPQASPNVPPIARAYELDLAAEGAPSPSPIEVDTLAAAMAAAGFDAVVLWLPPDDARVAELPVEPRCRLLETTETAGTLASAVAPFRARALRVAGGRRAAVDPALLPPIPRDRRVVVELGGDERVELARVRRPATREFLWCAPSELAAAERAPPLALSSRQLAGMTPELARRQLELDLQAFGSEPGTIEPAIERQSRIASALGALVASGDPRAFDPYLGLWIGDAPSEPVPPLRRGPPELDLEELLLSRGAAGESLLAAALRPEPIRGPWTEPPPAAGADGPRAGTPAPGVLTPDQCTAWCERIASRLESARELATALTAGRSDRIAALRARIDEDERRLDALAPAMAAAWRAALALDRALVDSVEPWRIRSTTWRIATAARPGLIEPITLVRVDDPRLGAWAPRVEEALGSRRLDLWKLVDVRPGVEVTLATDVALRDARNVRLRVDAAATRAVRVNGNETVSALRSGRGPLLTTLPLPAGANRIEVVLTLDGGSGDVGLDLDLVLNRVEGIVLEPERARPVLEPLVRLSDPTALGSTEYGGVSLVRPAGRPTPRSATDSARASLPFSIAREQRLDVWVHVVPLADRAVALALRFDEGPTRELPLPPDTSWIWVRAPAPATLAPGDHALHLLFPVENVRVDQVTLLATELALPRVPAGDAPIAATAWRFDPIGAGITIDLPPLRPGELFGRAFSLDRGGSFDAYVWLKGTDPLAPGQRAELEISSPSGRQRFVLPAGIPYEEWIALGSLVFASGDRVELQAHGDGALARVAFLGTQR